MSIFDLHSQVLADYRDFIQSFFHCCRRTSGEYAECAWRQSQVSQFNSRYYDVGVATCFTALCDCKISPDFPLIVTVPNGGEVRSPATRKLFAGVRAE
jgi:hypothetical protein